jgi:hypothetical protein
VKDLFTSFAAGTEVIVASRDEETPVYQITAARGSSAAIKAAAPQTIRVTVQPPVPPEVKADVKPDIRLHPKWKPTPLGF